MTPEPRLHHQETPPWTYPRTPKRTTTNNPATDINWATVLTVTIVFALVATLVILHLTGIVGPAD